MDIPIGNDPDFIAWASDTLRNLLPQVERLKLSIEALGDPGTLRERLQAEVATTNTIVPWQGVVSAWSGCTLRSPLWKKSISGALATGDIQGAATQRTVPIQAPRAQELYRRWRLFRQVSDVAGQPRLGGIRRGQWCPLSNGGESAHWEIPSRINRAA
jgi:hypothetical protein